MTNTGEVDIVITQIDRVAPSIDQIDYATSPTNQPLPITIIAHDIASPNGYPAGLMGDAYSFNEGVTWTGNTTLIVTGNTSLHIVVRDAAGNTTGTVVNITNIDTIPPVVTLSGAETLKLLVGSGYTEF